MSRLERDREREEGRGRERERESERGREREEWMNVWSMQKVSFVVGTEA